jgi:hypothetical protein
VKFTQNGKSPRNAAICCNWLQVFHTKVTKETKRKAEAKLGAIAAISCNWLQGEATKRQKNAQNGRFGATGCDWHDEIWADTQVSPTGGDWLQVAATGCKWLQVV